MKIRICFLAVTCLLLFFSGTQAQEYGKLRALQQRAAFVTNQKNSFIASVLTSYNIPHERNTQGAVIKIYLDNKWLDINAVEIIPLLKESGDNKRQVTAHELYFFTANGILDLISELIIK